MFSIFKNRRQFATCAAVAFLITMVSIVPRTSASSDDALWTALREGKAIALIRHALAPGFSDPDGFKLGDCKTQRNLSKGGKRQAKRIGALFRKKGIRNASVLTSQWCRCRETANLMNIGKVKDLPVLNSFFENDELRTPQTKALKAWLSQQKIKMPMVLVTHQVNISAFTGTSTSSGEIVFVKFPIGKAPISLGTIETP